eukprot:31237-Pelagococcus_subviridis.AAC.21
MPLAPRLRVREGQRQARASVLARLLLANLQRAQLLVAVRGVRDGPRRRDRVPVDDLKHVFGAADAAVFPRDANLTEPQPAGAEPRPKAFARARGDAVRVRERAPAALERFRFRGSATTRRRGWWDVRSFVRSTGEFSRSRKVVTVPGRAGVGI